MSSLRRRAIVVSRARSAGGSSIGGRVSARAAAAESAGSASTRSQAIASRTSGRWKSAAGPERWNGIPRSSIAAATGPPRSPGSSIRTQTSSGRDPAREQRLDLAGDRLGLGALVGAAPEPELRVAEQVLELDHVALGVDLAVPAAEVVGAGRLERVEVVRVLAGERRQQRPLGDGRVLELVDHHVGEALGEGGADVLALGVEAVEGEEDVAAVEVAGRGDDPVVGGDEVGKLGVGRLGAGLERVDPLQQPRQQAGRVAADLVAAERQLVDAVEQHRQPLGRAEHVEERVEAGGVGVLAQEPFPDRVPGPDPELAVGIVEQRFRPAAKPLRSRPRRGDQQHPVGFSLAVGGEPRQAAGQGLALAGAGLAEEQQRPLGMANRALLRGRPRPCFNASDIAFARWTLLSADWRGICRRIVAEQRRIFDAAPGIEERTVYEGVGEGGDRALAIDRRCEDVVFAELERLAAERRLVRRRLRGAGGGDVRRWRRGAGRDRPDRRLAQRAPHAPLAQPQHRRRLGAVDGRRRVRLRPRLRRRRGVRRRARERRDPRRRADRTSAPIARSSRCSGSSPPSRAGRFPPLEALDGRVYRLRVVGSIAITASYVAAGRFDAMLSLRPCRSVDIAAAQLIVARGGRARRVRRARARARPISGSTPATRSRSAAARGTPWRTVRACL